jgi:hypothetical protein
VVGPTPSCATMRDWRRRQDRPGEISWQHAAVKKSGPGAGPGPVVGWMRVMPVAGSAADGHAGDPWIPRLATNAVMIRLVVVLLHSVPRGSPSRDSGAGRPGGDLVPERLHCTGMRLPTPAMTRATLTDTDGEPVWPSANNGLQSPAAGRVTGGGADCVDGDRVAVRRRRSRLWILLMPRAHRGLRRPRLSPPLHRTMSVRMPSGKRGAGTSTCSRLAAATSCQQSGYHHGG